MYSLFAGKTGLISDFCQFSIFNFIFKSRKIMVKIGKLRKMNLKLSSLKWVRETVKIFIWSFDMSFSYIKHLFFIFLGTKEDTTFSWYIRCFFKRFTFLLILITNHDRLITIKNKGQVWKLFFVFVFYFEIPKSVNSSRLVGEVNESHSLPKKIKNIFWSKFLLIKVKDD